jgi:N6-adenosine-specific RNA methylase IME4
MTNKRYKVLVIDPPYRYENTKTGGSMKSGSAQHYTTMSRVEIATMNVDKIMQDACVLFLWIPIPLLDEGIGILKSMGFAYKTSIIWYKVNADTLKGRLGMGYWFRGQAEVCLVGIHGAVAPFRCQLPNVIVEPATKHSRKPDGFWKLIENALSNQNAYPRIELFCRGEPRAGWDGFGNECTGERSVKLDLF